MQLHLILLEIQIYRQESSGRPTSACRPLSTEPSSLASLQLVRTFSIKSYIIQSFCDEKIHDIIRGKSRALSDTEKNCNRQTASKFTESVQQTQQRQRQRIYSRNVSINEILHFWLQFHSTKEKKKSFKSFCY